MIKSWEDLGDALANFENRISCLENTMPFYSFEKPEGKSQQRIIYELRQSDRALILHLQNKLNEHIDASKGKTSKYISYKGD